MYTMNKDWLTIRDVADHLSISPEMVYKLVWKGEMPAVHIGSSWRINRFELETWIHSRKTGSQKTSPLASLHTTVLADFKNRLLTHYGENFLALYIYGSVARGTQDVESDLDTLVILKNLGNRWKELKEIQKLAYSVSFGQGRSVVLSTTVATEDEFKTRKDPLYERIRKEGKKAA